MILRLAIGSGKFGALMYKMLHYVCMKTLLDEAMQQVRTLPEERQNDLGEILLTLVEQDASSYQLSDEQVEEVRRRIDNIVPLIPFESVFRTFNSKA